MYLKAVLPSIRLTLPELRLLGSVGVEEEKEAPSLPPHPVGEGGRVVVEGTRGPHQRVVNGAHPTQPTAGEKEECQVDCNYSTFRVSDHMGTSIHRANWGDRGLRIMSPSS